jgi:NADH-quinone oxidoreductase subunit K
MIPVTHYLFLSLALLLIGALGALTRRNLIIKLFSIELILIASTINLAAFARFFGDPTGPTFAVCTLIIVTAEVLVALAIITAVFRRWQTTAPGAIDPDVPEILLPSPINPSQGTNQERP